MRKPVAVVCVVTAACLLPFVFKAFALDDPLFLWATEQIQRHPLDPYGFQTNWYGTWQPMWTATHNPPAASYYIAAVACFFGTSEVAMHLAFILPAIGATLATWRLAGSVTSNQVTAAAVALATPAFLASSTSIMCDTLMTCFFAWAVALWIDGLRLSNWPRLAAASLFVALAVLTKYFALSLFPLLAACTFAVARPRQYAAALWLLVPAFIFAAFEFWTWKLYGTVHVLHASSVATDVDRGVPLWAKTLVGLSFAGGSFLPVVFFAPAIFSKRVTVAATLALGAVAVWTLILAWRPELGAISYHRLATWALALQLGLFVSAGVLVLWLAVPRMSDARKQPLLVIFSLWIVGTFVFASYLNWGNNVRSVLPMAPAVGVLVARRLEAAGVRRVWIPLVPSFVLSLAVAQADYAWANSWRDLATKVGDNAAGQTLWFQGHWGFQWYLERRGARPVDFVSPAWGTGDLLALPSDNVDTKNPPRDCVKPSPVQTEAEVKTLVSVMSRRVGAGFGSAFIGPLPFAFEEPDPQRCVTFTASKPGNEWAEGADVPNR
jgi:hypothetical protein